jgi:hypothetical protein
MDLKADLIDQTVNFAAWTTATGVPVTVTSATTGLSLWYRRGVAGAKVAISPSNLATLETAHADGGILAIEGAEHRLDLPDAATAAGALTVSWGGTATGITIDGGTANLIGQANTATDLTQIGGSVDSLTRFKASVDALTVAQVVDVLNNDETTFFTNLPVKNDNYYGSSVAGMVLAFISGTTNAFQARRVISSITDTGLTLITLEEALDDIPADEDTFILLGRITELS